MDGKNYPGNFEFIYTLTDGILILRENLIVDINESAVSLLGGEKHKYQYRPIDICIRAIDEPITDFVKVCKENKQEQAAIIMNTKGEQIPITLSASKLNEEHDIVIIKSKRQSCINNINEECQIQNNIPKDGSRHCEIWYKNLIDFLPDALFVTNDGEYMFANKAAADLLGVDNPDTLLGRNVIEHLHPEKYETHKERKYQLLKAPQKVVKTEQTLINEKNEIKEVQIISSPLQCRENCTVISLVRDITKEKQAEKSLRESEAKYEKLVEMCPDGIFILDENRIIFSNQSGADILNATSIESLIGRSFIDFAHPDFIQMINKRVSDIYNDNVQKQCFTQNRIIAMDGTIKDIEVVNVDYENKGKKQIINMVRDITEKKRAEEDKRRLEEAIAHDNLKTEFFSNISHELKTPLNIILGALQLISSLHNINAVCPNYEKYKNYFQVMKQNCYRLLRLINNLIDITKIDSGFLKINYINGDIIRLVEDIVKSIEVYTSSKGISLAFSKNIDEQIIAYDPDKIERVILNLLSNAIKFNKPEGKIEVYISNDSEKVFISVKDTGLGIPENMINKVFDRFNQVDDLFTRKTEGSGIGLSLVKALLIGHGGDIKLKSEFGLGSEFIVELPIRLVNDENKIKDDRFKEHEKVERINIEFSDIYSP